MHSGARRPDPFEKGRYGNRLRDDDRTQPDNSRAEETVGFMRGSGTVLSVFGAAPIIKTDEESWS